MEMCEIWEFFLFGLVLRKGVLVGLWCLLDFGKNTDWTEDGDWWSERLYYLYDWEGIRRQRVSEESHASPETESWEIWSCHWEMLWTTERKGMKSERLLVLYSFVCTWPHFEYLVFSWFLLCWTKGCWACQRPFRKRCKEAAKGADDRWEKQARSTSRFIKKVCLFSITHTNPVWDLLEINTCILHIIHIMRQATVFTDERQMCISIQVKS